APLPRVLVDLARELVGESRQVLRPQQRRHRPEKDRTTAEPFQGEPEPREVWVHAFEGSKPCRRELERQREQELLRGERALLELRSKTLEEYPFVGDVLVDEEDLVRRVRHDEGVFDLADDASEERLATVARLAFTEQRGLGGVPPPFGRAGPLSAGRG